MSESSPLDGILRGSDDTRLRATWRVVAATVAFLAVFVPLVVVVRAAPVPKLIRNAHVILPAAAGTAAVVVAAKRLEGRSVAAQGFSFDRQWWVDFVGGVGLGVLAQCVIHGLWVATGAATVVETLSTGVVSGAAVVVPVVGAAIGYLGIGLWEEALYRGVLVRNGVDGLVARGLTPRTAVLGVVVGGAVLFGVPHVFVPAAGASATFAAVQGVVAVVYYTAAYVLTEQLALPVGLHFSMNFMTGAVFPAADSGVPALVRFDRSFTGDPSVVGVMVVATVLLTLAVAAWVRLTRGEVSVRECFGTDAPPTGTAVRGDTDD
ncbi:type II CAAX prenyl endopeptidase Rce1 family protein [Halobaculum sp. MBLA0147]|uniref:CPBP family glutamic-type intramembrane protease n=1 Tax=Halobaculum sp. MBLA0147 TaxID=3079934 RepID=UPI00352611D7